MACSPMCQLFGCGHIHGLVDEDINPMRHLRNSFQWNSFALSAGDALESPAWRAVLPELVSKDDLASAAALNGIEFNFARAIGPALAGVVIAVAGVGSAFL